MNAPFYKFGAFGDSTALIAAFLLGLGFGFFLERAGFGSARKLTAQFYFRDLAVLKVMFTAIVTAMVGLFLLSFAGAVDLAQVSLKPTVLWPNILGGLILGVGFVVGGYCPGTSVASSATGRLDAWTYLGGVFFGMFAFGEAVGTWPGLLAWVEGTDAPRLTLAAWTGIPYGTLVLLVAIMAVVAFILAEWMEVKVGGRPVAEQPLIGVPPARLNPSRALLGLLLLGGLLAALAGNPYRGPNVVLREEELALMVQRGTDHVTADDLASWILAGTDDYRLLDVRPAQEFAKGTLPGAESVPLVDLPTAEFRPTDKLVLFSDGQTHAAQAWILLKARGMTSAYVLLGRVEAWNDEVLHPVVSVPPTPEDAKRIARARAFGGTPMTGGQGRPAVPLEAPPGGPSVGAPPPMLPPGGPAKPGPGKKRKEGC